MNEEQLLSAVKETLNSAASGRPAGLAAAIRSEAARRKAARRIRAKWTKFAILSASVAAAAAISLSMHAFVGEKAPQQGQIPAIASSESSAESALKLMICDTEEAILALTSDSGGFSESDDSRNYSVDWDESDADFDFAEALLAWQEAPLALSESGFVADF